MNMFALAGIFFVCAVAAFLIGVWVDQHYGNTEDLRIATLTFVVMVFFLTLTAGALIWGGLIKMGWLP